MIENLEIITVIMNTLKNILLKNNSPTIIKKLGKYRLHIVNKDIIYEINVFKGNHCIINSTYHKSTGDFVNSKLCDQFDEKLTNDELDEIARLLFDYEQKLLIGFSDLTEKLNRINFSEKHIILDYQSKYLEFNSVTKACEYCKETFDLPIQYTKGLIYSGELCIDNLLQDFNRKTKRNLDEKVNIKNLSLLNKFNNYQMLLKQDNIHTNIYGICALVSTYNCYPNIFNYDISIIKTILNDLGDNYDSVYDVAEFINQKLYELYGHPLKIILSNNLNNGVELESCIQEKIDNNRPVILALNPENVNSIGHAISIFGYDEFNYYYYENDLDNTTIDLILNEFTNSLQKYYTEKIKNNENKLKQFNTYYELLGIKQMNNYLDKFNVNDIKKYLKQNKFSKYGKFIKVNKRLINMSFKSFLITYLNDKLPDKLNIHLSEMDNPYFQKQR